MNKRRLYSLLVAVFALALFVATSITTTAGADLRTITVKLANGQVVEVVRDVTKGTPVEKLVPKGSLPIGDEPTPEEPTPPQEDPDGGGPGGESGGKGGGKGKDDPQAPVEVVPPKDAKPKRGSSDAGDRDLDPRFRNNDGTPSRSNPSLTETGAPGGSAFDELPAPTNARSVPNFIIDKFRVPIFLLPIYQAAGTQYGVRWEILAAINEIETDYGRNLNVSSAGAVGWMQFLPSTWRAYGVDANRDGRKDPYNPVDAIFAAARYLKAAGYEDDVRRSIFAYNNADWYVDSVMMRARLITGTPSDLTGSLTGLTEGRFPVYAKSRYADDLSERDLDRRVAPGENAANVQESKPGRRQIEIFADEGAPVVAVNDGTVQQVGRSRKLGRFVVLQDAYGNQFTYSGLGKTSKYYPVAKNQDEPAESDVLPTPARDAKPAAPASKGRQGKAGGTDSVGGNGASDAASAPATQQRLFANPDRPESRRNGGVEQIAELGAVGTPESFDRYTKFAESGFGLKAKNTRLERLAKGSKVTGGTLLGKVGTPDQGIASHLDFGIRPAGRGAPRIDPKPILDGWKLLEETSIYRANGDNVLQGSSGVGQVLLMSKPLLEKRVLSDNRIEIYPCGRQDIQTGQIDRRVLATLAYLSESGLRPTVTSLKCGHGIYTKGGAVSNHASGNAADIARINGVPILGHQENGGITEQTVRRLMQLQGTMRPGQIISLLDLGGNTLAMGDHADHIHVGFTPPVGTDKRLGGKALAVLKPDQWGDLVKRLGAIDQPTVQNGPDKFVLSADKRSSRAHRGE